MSISAIMICVFALTFVVVAAGMVATAIVLLLAPKDGPLYATVAVLTAALSPKLFKAVRAAERARNGKRARGKRPPTA